MPDERLSESTVPPGSTVSVNSGRAAGGHLTESRRNVAGFLFCALLVGRLGADAVTGRVEKTLGRIVGVTMSKKILTILSEYGYWGEELLGPVVAADEQGYQTVFATPTGGRARALPPSLDPGYIDPPLGRSVTTPEVAVAARALDGSARLDDPTSIAEWIPERP